MPDERIKKFLSTQGQTSPYPLLLELEKAEGVYFYDNAGKKYLDLIAGIAVGNAGHRHPEIIKAIKEQADKYLHTMVYGEFIQEPQLKLAEKLLQLFPRNLNSTYFVNSGTEANEAALKLAKRYTGRPEIISFHGAYHGSTHGSLSVSANEWRKRAFRPLLPGIRFLNYDRAEELKSITENTACVIIEPIQGDAGVRIPSREFMKALRKRCDETGSLLIFDEIQTGFGRTGKMFALEHFGISPDIITLAKGLGGGMPIGAFAASAEIMASFKSSPVLGHITTFGGHPLSCAAAIANLNVLARESLAGEAEDKGMLFENLLQHDKVKEIRRIGLMIAVELEDEEKVEQVVKHCLENGVLIYFFISCKNSFRIAPPLVITKKQIKKGCEIILEAIETKC